MSGNTKSRTVGVGDILIGKSPEVLRALAIGSCVAIALYDPHLKLGGLCHALLPYEADGRGKAMTPGKFADSATAILIKKVLKEGAKRDRVVAKLAGGARMFELKNKVYLDIGTRNIQSARTALENADIPIVAEDVGQNFGRTVHFDLSTGKLITLRAGGKHRREF